MNALVEFSVDVIMEETGQRRDMRRRLSDKILAAFNHAYSVGEYDIAELLRDALLRNEAAGVAAGGLRAAYDPLGEAELWIGFVDARNRYRAACEADAGNADAVAEALDAMKQAYRVWSGG